jgi:signal transduction histidine kinase
MRALEGGGIETVVADDAEPERRRRSLEGIEERVKQLHGSIQVDAEDPGTRVVVTLPPYASRR